MNEEEINKIIEVYDNAIAGLKQENQQLKEKVGELTQSLNEQMKETNKENLDCSEYAIENNHLKERYLLLEDKCIDLKEVIEEVREDIVFCINGMKNEFACTDSRTNRELHTMVKILEEGLRKIDKTKVEDERPN